VEGLGIEEPKEKEKIVERVFWIKAPESAEKAPPESGRQQPQTLAEFEARLANSEEDPKE
jgi:hypothetical protein